MNLILGAQLAGRLSLSSVVVECSRGIEVWGRAVLQKVAIDAAELGLAFEVVSSVCVSVKSY